MPGWRKYHVSEIFSGCMEKSCVTVPLEQDPSGAELRETPELVLVTKQNVFPVGLMQCLKKEAHSQMSQERKRG